MAKVHGLSAGIFPPLPNKFSREESTHDVIAHGLRVLLRLVITQLAIFSLVHHNTHDRSTTTHNTCTMLWVALQSRQLTTTSDVDAHEKKRVT